MSQSPDRRKYLALLGGQFPTRQALSTEIINLSAILNLPKGTEHFISDLHGEYEAFQHIMNNCSGVIREKVTLLFAGELSAERLNELCTLIYYPEQKLKQLELTGAEEREWYRRTLSELIRLARLLSSKYTRSKVRKAIPAAYSYLIDELLHAQPDEDANQYAYHAKLIDTLMDIGSASEYIFALCALVKRLAVDRLHVLGDVFDRGGGPDAIMDILMQHPAVDFTWGNHDALWMGAAAGNEACAAAAVRNSLAYGHQALLEHGYGISLRQLWMLAQSEYPALPPAEGALRVSTLLMFKLEGQLIARHPEYGMDDRRLLHRVDWTRKLAILDGNAVPLVNWDFPTVDPANPYELTPEERELMDDLTESFRNSPKLQRHIGFLYERGTMYRRCNGNLLYHGCIPMTEDGRLREVVLGGRAYAGKALMDYCEQTARRAWLNRESDALDFMWYLWCGASSPLCGRRMLTFAHLLTASSQPLSEPQDPYYVWNRQRETCEMLLHSFELDAREGRIINGHTPVLLPRGESPIRGGGKLLVIDGGLCKAYQRRTGIAGYTLIVNSHGMRVVAHQPFLHPDDAVAGNADIVSVDAELIPFEKRQMVADTDDGAQIRERIADLRALL